MRRLLGIIIAGIIGAVVSCLITSCAGILPPPQPPPQPPAPPATCQQTGCPHGYACGEDGSCYELPAPGPVCRAGQFCDCYHMPPDSPVWLEAKCPAGAACQADQTCKVIPPPPPPQTEACVPDTSGFEPIIGAKAKMSAEVQMALNRVCAVHPSIFVSPLCTQLKDKSGPSIDAFFALVADEILADGVCAGQPVEGDQRIDKLAVQSAPSLWEMYHLVNYGSGELLTVNAAYLRGGTWGNPGPVSCGPPDPPPLSRINAKIHLKGGPWTTLDSTPLVRDYDYCTKIGLPRGECPVRVEGAPDRFACELAILGGGEVWSWTPDHVTWKRVYMTDGWPQRINPENPFQFQVAKGIPGFAKVCNMAEVICTEVEVP